MRQNGGWLELHRYLRLRRAVVGWPGTFFWVLCYFSARGRREEGREKRVHVSEILPVGGAVLFMREKGKVGCGVDLSLPGRAERLGLEI